MKYDVFYKDKAMDQSLTFKVVIPATSVEEANYKLTWMSLDYVPVRAVKLDIFSK